MKKKETRLKKRGCHIEIIQKNIFWNRKNTNLQPLFADYSTVYAEPRKFFDKYNRHYIDKFYTAQPLNNMQYMPGPVFNNIETPPQLSISVHTTTATAVISYKCFSYKPAKDSGKDKLGIRTLFTTLQQVTSPRNHF